MFQAIDPNGWAGWFDRPAGGADQPAFRLPATPARTRTAAAMARSPTTTPRDYHRIASTTLIIPTDVAKPIPVGLLSCQRQPLIVSVLPAITRN